MAVLSDPVKRFIVERLACYDTPQEIADAVKEEFEVTIKRQQVEEYDPAKRKPGKKWADLHAEIRKRFLADLSTEPAAEKSYRVRQLAKMARAAQARKNYPEARALYRQIAEEVGGLLTNRRELTGKDGKPLVPDRALEDLTEAELIALANRIAEGRD